VDNQLPVLFVRSNTDKSNSTLDCYAIPEGTELKSFTIPSNTFPRAVNCENTLLLVVDWYELKAYCFDIKTHKQVWAIDYSDLVEDKTHIDNMPETLITPDGDGVILLFKDRVIARTNDGKELWKLDAAKGSTLTWARPGIAPDCVLLQEEGTLAIQVVSMRDGRVLRSIKDIHVGDIRAYTSEAKVIALAAKGELYFVDHFDFGNKVKIADVSGSVDAAFSPDAKQLVCLPSLRRVEGSKTEMTRATNNAYVIDVGTAKIAKIVDIEF
jgi:outer membrane protein assembly factor BamB